ncbi:MAG: HDOD domain-containing protein [Verrucomicrobia bacterium]|nr:HDOD domain-containing protein [Verrucomicrobiota bacterium]
MEATPAPCPVLRLDEAQIEARLKNCARLPSLGSINSALRELLSADSSYIAQISEVIRRDPSLTARLLRLVNSVYFGLSAPVHSIEEAIFYLGVRQIRQLAMLTPVIEDFQKLAGNVPFPWREFWRHCIGVAMMTREVISIVRTPSDEADYVAGLVHDVGKIAMAAAFSEHFAEIQRRLAEQPAQLLEVEMAVLGMNHCDLGARYLQNHNLPEAMIETARHHHQPEHASHHVPIVAAVSVADLLVRHAKIGVSGNVLDVEPDSWRQSSAWALLFPHLNEQEHSLAQASLQRSLGRLPVVLEGLI